MPEAVSNTETVEFDLGILLVHGIGQQKRGETLTKWGDALVHTLERATASSVRIHTEEQLANGGEATGRIIVTIHSSDHEERWLLAEAWWADAFNPPSFQELLTLSFRAIPWSIASHFAHRAMRPVGESRSGLNVLVAHGRTALGLLIGLMLSPLLLTLLVLLGVLGILPIPRLRTFIMMVQTKLSGTIGDCLAYCSSPFGGAAILGVVRRAIREMRVHRCRQLAVLAHSQGAALMLDALGGILPRSQLPGQEDEHDALADTPVDLLLTFGAGIKKLGLIKWQLAESADAQRPAATKRKGGSADKHSSAGDIVRRTSWAFIACAGATIYLLWSIWNDDIALVAQLFFLMALLLGGLAVGGIVAGLTALAKRRPSQSKLLVSVGVASFLAWCAGLIWLGEQQGAAVVPLCVLIFALGLSIAGCREIISGRFAKELCEHIRKPPRVARWFDLYASADPVSAGALSVADRSTELWNEGSLLADHTTYWQNEDGFVLRILHHLADRRPLAAKLTPAPADDDLAQRGRVRWLHAARWIPTFAWLGSGWILLRSNTELAARVAAQLQGLIPQPLSWLSTLLDTPRARSAIALGCCALLAWLFYLGSRACWRRWNRAEAHRWLSGDKSGGRSRPFWVFASVYSLSVAVPIVLSLRAGHYLTSAGGSAWEEAYRLAFITLGCASCHLFAALGVERLRR